MDNKKKLPEEIMLTEASDKEVERQMQKMSRRSLLQGAAAVAGVFLGFHFLDAQPNDDGIPWPFRRALEVNQDLWQDLTSTHHLAPTYPRSSITHARTNGDLGLSDDVDIDSWRLHVEGLQPFGAAQNTTADFTLEDIKKLPQYSMITEFRCIEGWNYIMQWKGARFADFMRAHSPELKTDDNGNPLPPVQGHPVYVNYVSIETPDKGYYVGLDMESALHPQTLLCYEMNGQPLTQEHGAPLRLIIPVKYGVKNIKRLGTIRYTNQRPRDYWAEQGYDWYAEL